MTRYQVDFTANGTIYVEANSEAEAVDRIGHYVGRGDEAWEGLQLSSRDIYLDNGVFISPFWTARGFDPQEVCLVDELSHQGNDGWHDEVPDDTPSIDTSFHDNEMDID